MQRPPNPSPIFTTQDLENFNNELNTAVMFNNFYEIYRLWISEPNYQKYFLGEMIFIDGKPRSVTYEEIELFIVKLNYSSNRSIKAAQFMLYQLLLGLKNYHTVILLLESVKGLKNFSDYCYRMLLRKLETMKSSCEHLFYILPFPSTIRNEQLILTKNTFGILYPFLSIFDIGIRASKFENEKHIFKIDPLIYQGWWNEFGTKGLLLEQYHPQLFNTDIFLNLPQPKDITDGVIYLTRTQMQALGGFVDKAGITDVTFKDIYPNTPFEVKVNAHEYAKFWDTTCPKHIRKQLRSYFGDTTLFGQGAQPSQVPIENQTNATLEQNKTPEKKNTPS